MASKSLVEMSVFELVRGLGSFRKCRDEVIPRKTMGKILDAGRRAPSPGNVQSLEFIVVEDDHLKESLSRATDDERIEDAPAVVIVIASLERMARQVGEEAALEACSTETGCSVTNMRLVAEENDIASCWVSGFDKQMVADQFDIPEGKLPMSVVVFGYSDHKVPQEPKFQLNEICFYDMYDNQINSLADFAEWKGLREEKEIYGKKAEGLKKKVVDAVHRFL